MCKHVRPCPSYLLSSIPTSFLVIDKAANEFEQMNGSKTITPEFEFNVSQAPLLVLFTSFYQRFNYLLSLENPQNRPMPEPFDTTPPSQRTIPSAVMNTPPPSTNPVDPQYSSASNTTSASYTTSASGESKDEESPDSCVNDFVQATFLLLKSSLDHMAWYKGTNNRLQQTYFPSSVRLILGSSKKLNFS